MAFNYKESKIPMIWLRKTNCRPSGLSSNSRFFNHIAYRISNRHSAESEIDEPSHGKPTMLFPNRSDINQAVQSQKKAGSLKFQI